MISIKHISTDNLSRIVRQCNSIAEIIRKLGYVEGRTSYKSLYNRLKCDNIDISHITLGLNNRRGKQPTNKLSKSEYVKKYLTGENYSKPQKSKLIEFGLLENRCYGMGCVITTDWLGNNISLQVDHIDGNRYNNKIENLRLLCPNCHSQTLNWSGRNNKHHYFCKGCGVDIGKTASFCVSCSNKSRIKFTVTTDELRQLILSTPMTQIGKKFGVSDNAIRKRAKLLGIV